MKLNIIDLTTQVPIKIWISAPEHDAAYCTNKYLLFLFNVSRKLNKQINPKCAWLLNVAWMQYIQTLQFVLPATFKLLQLQSFARELFNF